MVNFILGGNMDKKANLNNKLERAFIRANRKDVFSILETINSKREEIFEKLGVTVEKKDDPFYVEDWNPSAEE
jgi:hypothetical protein